MSPELQGLPLWRVTDPPTSRAAAESMVESAKAQRVKVVEMLRAIGPSTYEQIAAAARMDRHAVARRLPEALREGRVKRMQATRKTSSGRLAHLWYAL